METTISPLGYNRQAAVKISISLILKGILIQEQDEPSYLQTADEHKLFRVNVMASLLSREKTGSVTSLLLDDGTGQITLRYFEESPTVSFLSIGDVLLIIGRVRSYNQEKYLSAEIIKKAHPFWLKVRKEELKLSNSFSEDIQNETFKAIPEEIIQEKLKGEKTEEKDMEEVSFQTEDSSFPMEKIIKKIKELDQGPGALIEEIMEKLPLPEVEQTIEKMLKEGLIFQIRPGWVKVL